MTLPKTPIIALERVDFLPANRVTDDTSILTLKALVLEPMLRWEDGAIRPGLFADWHCEAEGRRWVMTLPAGKRFHDGTIVTAQDTVDFIDRILESRDMFGMPWSYASYLAGAQITTEGAALTITTPLPFPDLPEILSEFYLSRLDAQDRSLIGTGPWQVDSFDPGQSATLRRQSDGRTLSVVAMPLAEDRLRALKAGDVQAATHLERLESPQRHLADHTWHEQPVSLSVMAYLNGTEGAFSDPNARLAANLALDRPRLITDVMGGLAVAANTIVSPWHFGHAEAALPHLTYDPEGARCLLETSGASRDVVLRTPTYMPERAPEIAQLMADAWNAVGFNTRIEIAEDRPQYARDLGEKQMGDAAIFDSSPHSTFRVLDDKISSLTRGIWWQGVADQQVDADFNAARHENDDTRRAQTYGQVLHRLQAAPPWAYLFHPVLCLAHHPTLNGLSLDHKGILRIA